jgi:predicted RNase H-like HicB family nuclease
MEFTAIYVTAPDGSIAAHVEEFPNVVTRGRTIGEARDRAAAAVRMLLDMARTECAAETERQAVLLRETVTIEDDGTDA